MKIYRTPNDCVVVLLIEAEGVTDDDIERTLATSQAVCALIELDDVLGVLPLGAPSQGPAGRTLSTKIAFNPPPIMWFQEYDDEWEWAPDGPDNWVEPGWLTHR